MWNTEIEDAADQFVNTYCNKNTRNAYLTAAATPAQAAGDPGVGINSLPYDDCKKLTKRKLPNVSMLPVMQIYRLPGRSVGILGLSPEPPHQVLFYRNYFKGKKLTGVVTPTPFGGNSDGICFTSPSTLFTVNHEIRKYTSKSTLFAVVGNWADPAVFCYFRNMLPLFYGDITATTAAYLVETRGKWVQPYPPPRLRRLFRRRHCTAVIAALENNSVPWHTAVTRYLETIPPAARETAASTIGLTHDNLAVFNAATPKAFSLPGCGGDTITCDTAYERNNQLYTGKGELISNFVLHVTDRITTPTGDTYCRGYAKWADRSTTFFAEEEQLKNDPSSVVPWVSTLQVADHRSSEFYALCLELHPPRQLFDTIYPGYAATTDTIRFPTYSISKYGNVNDVSACLLPSLPHSAFPYPPFEIGNDVATLAHLGKTGAAVCAIIAGIAYNVASRSDRKSGYRLFVDPFPPMFQHLLYELGCTAAVEGNDNWPMLVQQPINCSALLSAPCDIAVFNASQPVAAFAGVGGRCMHIVTPPRIPELRDLTTTMQRVLLHTICDILKNGIPATVISVINTLCKQTTHVRLSRQLRKNVTECLTVYATPLQAIRSFLTHIDGVSIAADNTATVPVSSVTELLLANNVENPDIVRFYNRLAVAKFVFPTTIISDPIELKLNDDER